MATETELPAVDRSLLSLAVAVAHAAGAITTEGFQTAERQARIKRDGSVVTRTDQAVEDMMRRELGRQTPDDGILGEENGSDEGISGRRWVIDPIDGTRFFTNGIPVFTNLLAYEDEHGSAIGVINMPMQQELVFAGRGLGCWIAHGANPNLDKARQVRIGNCTHLGTAVVHGTHTFTWTVDFMAALHAHCLLQCNRGDDAYGIAMLVTGRADAVVSVHTGKHWDWAPVPVIVSEAGGVATDLRGRALPGDGSSLATNPALHLPLLDLLSPLPRIRRWKHLAGTVTRPRGTTPPQ
ncbi:MULTISPECIES: inositol monophosphatase family protein [unclassified Crossiella]|uniref:inositol monophosphatase family protein n=1 Tax=unclassified Crossiella TaxID=2620835 RepID=UPI001FFEF545|nr:MULTISPECIES: inositol monophosphatase family protein [unclassified Crossiella]MCK2245192.1 hypothetical protein [Crossiella sp. S99.2]MCK2258886.1 hypothetical protein [Crossiella sp. S99.1]